MAKPLEIIARDAKQAAIGAAKGTLHATYFPLAMCTSVNNGLFKTIDYVNKEDAKCIGQIAAYSLAAYFGMDVASDYIRSLQPTKEAIIQGLAILLGTNLGDLAIAYANSVKKRAQPPQPTGNSVPFAKPEDRKIA